ncbi:MAG: PDZ domain-containing protein [Planctomycetes bacterium]|nr:PDZ domain-containing protein [Planctomycetota bacterium]
MRIWHALVLSSLAASVWAQEEGDDPSQAHVRIYKKVAPSVVFVSGGSQRGSGAVIDKDGYILTSPTACGHTTTEVSVVLPGHRRVTGKVAGRVNEMELVVVKVPAKDLPAMEMGDSDQAKVGAVTYVLGDSFGSIESDDQVAISMGVLSSVYEVESVAKGTGAFYTGPVLETSAAVNQNQDGGPLVDAQGRLLGMVTLNYETSRFTGIAIPVNRLRTHIERIIEQDRTGIARAIEPGWFGADVQEDDEAGGLTVYRVQKNGPAAKGGLRKGDVIRQVNRQRVMTRKRFADLLRREPAGAVVVLRVRRDGRETDLTITLGEKTWY